MQSSPLYPAIDHEYRSYNEHPEHHVNRTLRHHERLHPHDRSLRDTSPLLAAVVGAVVYQAGTSLFKFSPGTSLLAGGAAFLVLAYDPFTSLAGSAIRAFQGWPGHSPHYHGRHVQ